MERSYTTTDPDTINRWLHSVEGTAFVVVFSQGHGGYVYLADVDRVTDVLNRTGIVLTQRNNLGPGLWRAKVEQVNWKSWCGKWLTFPHHGIEYAVYFVPDYVETLRD